MPIKKSGKAQGPGTQQELPGMPKRSPAGEKAVEYLDLKSQIDKDHETLDKIGQELIVLMHKENRSKITIAGATLTVRMIAAQEKINIKKEV
ncbi:MAG: hypothetical protein PHI86_00025 [Candidatus Omnitrophica bacterium]|nr:hypothetical protein [Candidatus Omnitrophota bacterium]HOX55181.1 hypothetical protein [Candidatus Omnitrophota bacterium]